MKIFITGGTGFIGQALVQALLADNHSLTLLCHRRLPNLPDVKAVKICQNLADLPDFNGFDAVINLAGEPIFAKRWRAEQKAKLRDSRLHLTAQLVEKIQQSSQPPQHFLSASAIGFYGDVPANQTATETQPVGNGFASQLCQQWEEAALQAQSAQTRVCLLRTANVMSQTGGALSQMLPLYRCGLGGKLGSGKQHWAWISLNDQIRAILFLLAHPELSGAFNLAAPELIKHRDINRQLAQALHRPAFCHAPTFVLRLLLGERANLLLDNQPVLPERLQAAGFVFQDPRFADWAKQTLA